MQKVIMFGTLISNPTKTKVSGPCEFILETSNEIKGSSQRNKVKHKIIIWGGKADLCLKYMKAGDKILIEGIINYSMVEHIVLNKDKTPVMRDGKPYILKKKKTEIKVISLNFV